MMLAPHYLTSGATTWKRSISTVIFSNNSFLEGSCPAAPAKRFQRARCDALS